LTELSKEIKQDLNEIKATEEYLKILHTKLNQKKNKAKEITKQFIKLI
jgi:protein involved in ribonucleotide reduction